MRSEAKEESFSLWWCKKKKLNWLESGWAGSLFSQQWVFWSPPLASALPGTWLRDGRCGRSLEASVCCISFINSAVMHPVWTKVCVKACDDFFKYIVKTVPRIAILSDGSTTLSCLSFSQGPNSSTNKSRQAVLHQICGKTDCCVNTFMMWKVTRL